MSSTMGLVHLLVISLLSHRLGAADSPSLDTLSACTAIYRQYPHSLVWDPLGPNGLETVGSASLYHTTNVNYWNEENSKNRAACTFYPASADHVSYAVKVLNNHTEALYAIKSGGHNANYGFSSVDQGVLIAFQPNLASTTLSSDRQTADVGPGARWVDVATVVDRYGKAVVGGRLGDVGVGGYTLGGGLSFLTSQYVSVASMKTVWGIWSLYANAGKGFACDTVVEYEIVLADGTIAYANANSDTDLFYALKGGGSQFGIVTNFKMRLYDIGQVWGGTKIYSGSDYEAIIGATTNFTITAADPKAAVIVTFDYTLATAATIIVMFYFYDGPVPPAGIFDQFDAVTPLESQVSTQSYPSLVGQNDQFSLKGFRYQIREATYPVMPYEQNVEFLEYHYQTFKEFSFSQAIQNLDIQVLTWSVQPVGVNIKQASQDAGGNRLGLDAANGDTIFMEYDISWVDPLYDSSNPLVLQKIATELQTYQATKYAGVEPTHYQSGDVDFISYNPIFMNDGMYDQDVLQSYGAETYQKLKKIQLERDPKGFLSKRQDGFKFST